jgi:hypothetical protein
MPDRVRAAVSDASGRRLDLDPAGWALLDSRCAKTEETGVTQSDRLILERGAQAHEAPLRAGGDTQSDALDRGPGEQAARRTLRAQIGRLERELSVIVAERFPYISAAPGGAYCPYDSGSGEPSCLGPSLLGLDQLERTRDRLAARLQDLRGLAAERDEYERSAHELLQRMKLEPGRYKNVRLPVSELGQGGCGVWEVRPRLGLIGMLAGWWQLKLSSGCPLPRGSRPRRGPYRLS